MLLQGITVTTDIFSPFKDAAGQADIFDYDKSFRFCNTLLSVILFPIILTGDTIGKQTYGVLFQKANRLCLHVW